VLTTVAAIRSLTAADAQKHIPLHLRGIDSRRSTCDRSGDSHLLGNQLSKRVEPSFNRFADLDGVPLLEKVLGKQGAETLARDLARCYTVPTHQYVLRLPKLGIDKPGVPLQAYWMQTKTLIETAKLETYMRWLADDYRPALEKAGVAQFEVS
jgi:hypothetical protein